MEEVPEPSYIWRRLFSEALGTFLLVLVAAGAGVVSQASGVPISRAAAVTAPGLMVMAVILFMGKVGGAHLNPVVSLAFALRSEFPWKRVPAYLGAQAVGGLLACLFFALLFGTKGSFGTTIPGPGINDWQAFGIEVVLTMGLVSVILGTASSAQNVGALSAIAVGGYIALAGLWASPISGASMNPIRSLAPALISLKFSHIWVYLVGPMLGAIMGVGFGYLLRGTGGDMGAKTAAQGN